MGRWVRYGIFFMISGVIHLFLCVDFLKLKTVLPQLEVQPLVETFRNIIHSSPPNTQTQNLSRSESVLPSAEDPSFFSKSPTEEVVFLTESKNSTNSVLNPTTETEKKSLTPEPELSKKEGSPSLVLVDSVNQPISSLPMEEKNEKILSLQDYESHLQKWMSGFSPSGNWPPIRLISETTTADVLRREKKQGYQIVCYPQKDPQYFITVSADLQGQLSYEKRVDTYTLKAKYSGTLRENSPLFQRIIAEVGSNTQLYHPRDGSLVVVHLVPKKLERYIGFKQHLAASQLGLTSKEIQALVGSFRETAFDEDVFIFSGILTRDGRKLYPKDPELDLLEFK